MNDPISLATEAGRRWAAAIPTDQRIRLDKLYHANVDTWDEYFAGDKNAFVKFFVQVIDPTQSYLNPHPPLKFWATVAPNAAITPEFVQAFAQSALSTDRPPSA